jgi:acetyl esterase/lipase
VNRKNVKKSEAVIKTLKSIHSIKDNMDIDKQRHAQETLGNLFTKVRGIDYESLKIGDMNAEWIKKARGYDHTKVILYCHGGAYLTGNIAYSRILGTKLAKACGFPVLTIEYRLAPENPYPAALEDAKLAWDYLIECGYSADHIVLAGESAGGNLILSLAHYLKLKNEALPTALVCMSPWTNLNTTSESYETKKDVDPILTYEFLKSATNDYARDNDLSNPLISPLYGDFDGFPPTFIQVGSNEILLDDSIHLRDRLLSCNVECYLEVWEGMWHVFQMLPMKKATRALQNISIFLTSNSNKTSTIL